SSWCGGTATVNESLLAGFHRRPAPSGEGSGLLAHRLACAQTSGQQAMTHENIMGGTVMRRVAPGLLRAASGMAVALCLVLSSNLTGAEAKTIKFAWTSTDSPTDPYGIVGAEFKKNLEELTNSELEVQLFPNRQLGDEKEILEGIRFGTIEAGVVTNAVVANVHKPLQVNDMPFLYPSAEVAHRILDGELGQELLAGLEDKGIIGLRFCEGGFRSMINNVRPVTQPSDV